MPNIMDDFTHLDGLSIPELHGKYQMLKGEGPSTQLSDEVLQELLAITRILRKRSTAPQAKKSSAKIAPSLDAL